MEILVIGIYDFFIKNFSFNHNNSIKILELASTFNFEELSKQLLDYFQSEREFDARVVLKNIFYTFRR
jgi:hypothetical protein